MVDLTSLNCENCPALYLRDKQLPKIARCEALRDKEFRSLKEIKLYLLGESIPANRFFYNRDSDYSTDGLRFWLRKELVGDGTEEELFDYLREKGILLVDCAICPLHTLKEIGDKILAATLCLQRNTLGYLSLNPQAPIITIFPSGRGFAKDSLPEVNKRVVCHFQFTKLAGLKKVIEDKLDRGNCS